MATDPDPLRRGGRRLNARTVLVGCAIAAGLSMAVDRAPWPEAHAQAVLDAPPCAGARREPNAAFARPWPAQHDEQVRIRLQIEHSRGLVAQRCFGREPDSASTRGAAVPPAPAVPQGSPGAPTAARPPTAPSLPQPPVDIQRPTFTTLCDPGGCWDSSGARHHGTPGTTLTGPRGTCTTSPAGVVSCF